MPDFIPISEKMLCYCIKIKVKNTCSTKVLEKFDFAAMRNGYRISLKQF